MKRILLLTTVFMMMLGTSFSSAQTDADNFYKSDLVSVEKVSFSNQYKMKVAGNLFLPKNMKEGDKYPAIIVGHPMGAVKEQSANLYATKMAERGFVTLSINSRDYPVIMGITVFIAAAVLIGNMIVDLVYGLLDPKIRYS
jgi:hypothetical protein